MAQEDKDRGKYSAAIIGAGASGCLCAYFLLKAGLDVTLYDKGKPLATLLPTGGGRCNLAHSEYDFKELAKNYPRGEKFLYSVFSRFSTADTVNTFEELGIRTYIQEDGRIFPKSDSAKDVRERLIRNIKLLGGKFVNEEVKDVKPFLDNNLAVVIATGGHSGYDLLKPYGIKIIEPKPSLVGLKTKEDFKMLAGTSVGEVEIDGINGDILFTHFGVSGPLIYKISSLRAFDNVPYELNINLCPVLNDFQKVLNENPKKEIKNVIGEFLPQKLAGYILGETDERVRACDIDGKTRDSILDKINNFRIMVIGTNKGDEVVTAGGVDLDEIDSRTMGVKKVPNLYCIGEVLNIDGFCGGFNLQNAWSTAYVCAEGITL